MTASGYGPCCSHWPNFEFNRSTYVGDAAVSRNEGDLVSPATTCSVGVWKTEASPLPVGLASGGTAKWGLPAPNSGLELFHAPGHDMALSISRLRYKINATAGCKAESWRFFKQHLLPTSTCNPCVYQTRTPNAADQWPADISAAVSRPVVVGAGSADESG